MKSFSHDEKKQLIKKSKKLLFKTLNCCETQTLVGQELLEIKNDSLVRGTTGLAGGICNNGSTCGVVIGSSINQALWFYKNNKEWNNETEAELLNSIRNFIDDFKKTFGSTLCRERTDLDLTKMKGKLGLLIPKRAKGCVKQTEFAIDYFLKKLSDNGEKEEELSDNKFLIKLNLKKRDPHCAKDVLAFLKQKTGIGDELIEQISVIFDGGISLSGNTCGALIGGLVFLGMKYRTDYSIEKAGKIRNLFKNYPPQFMKRANKLVNEFSKKYGSLECNYITGNLQGFNNWESFQKQRKSEKCNELISFVINKVLEL